MELKVKSVSSDMPSEITRQANDTAVITYLQPIQAEASLASIRPTGPETVSTRSVDTSTNHNGFVVEDAQLHTASEFHLQFCLDLSEFIPLEVASATSI